MCREQSVGKLARSRGASPSCPARPTTARSSSGQSRGATGCSSCSFRGGSTTTRRERPRRCSTTRARGARLVFSCGWHITRDGQDVYSWKLKAIVKVFGPIARLARFADLDDQVEACRRVFASDTRWTVVRGSDLEEGESQGLPVWSRHVGDPILESNLTRRVDFALFMVEALENDGLVHEAPAIVGRLSPRRSRTPPAEPLCL